MSLIEGPSPTKLFLPLCPFLCCCCRCRCRCFFVMSFLLPLSEAREEGRQDVAADEHSARHSMGHEKVEKKQTWWRAGRAGHATGICGLRIASDFLL